MKPAMFLAIFVAACSSAFGWSSKEHIQITRLAAARLIADPSTPEAMKAWLKDVATDADGMEAEKDYFINKRVGIYPRGVDGVAFWSVMPDLVAAAEREKVVEPFGVNERMLHFVDLELLNADPARRVYSPDPANRVKLADVPRDMKDPRWAKAGMLPFRVQDCYARMVKDIRAGRLNDRPGQFPRDEHVAKWAGYLSHYLADSTQPHHATIDYQSQSYVPRPAATTGPASRRIDVHGDLEYRLVDDDFEDYPELRKEFWPIFAKKLAEMKDPIETADLFDATMQTLWKSYEGLPLIGAAARAAHLEADGHVKRFDASAFFHTKGQCAGREMTVMELKAEQLAWAVLRVEKVWRAAWDEAGKRPGVGSRQ